MSRYAGDAKSHSYLVGKGDSKYRIASSRFQGERQLNWDSGYKGTKINYGEFTVCQAPHCGSYRSYNPEFTTLVL